MRFLNNNFYLICIFAGGMGALIMFYFLFHETFFNGNPIHPGFEGTYNGIQNYLLEYPKLIFMVWFAITRMAFYFIVLTPLLLFFADEWKKNKTISVAGKLARIILPLLPLLVIRLVISTYKTHTDSVQNQLLESSETILTTSSVIGLFIAIVTAFGMILSAVRASSIKNFSISDYNDSLKSINYFMIILGITASFSAVWHLLFRNAYVQVHPEDLAQFPTEWSYGVALVNSTLIALIYFPVRLYLEYLKNKHLDNSSGTGYVNTAMWMGLFSELKTLIPLFSPILSTALAGIVG